MTALTVLSNEKKQEAKDLIGGKKKTTKRPALGASKTVGAGRADTGTYEEALDDSGDYDDFVSPCHLALFVHRPTSLIVSCHIRCRA